MHTSRLIQFGLIASLLILLSCSVRKTESVTLDLSLRNDTDMALDWVKVDWDGPYVPGGILPSGIEKTAVGVRVPKSEVATLSFVEDAGRQPHSIRLDVSRLQKLESGRHEAVLAIVSLSEAKLLVDEGGK